MRTKAIIYINGIEVYSDSERIDSLTVSLDMPIEGIEWDGSLDQWQIKTGGKKTILIWVDLIDMRSGGMP